MQKPAKVSSITNVNWQESGNDFNIPAVFHSAWTSQGGRFALVLANWTKKKQVISFSEKRLGRNVDMVTFAKSKKLRKGIEGHKITLQLPPLSCSVVASKG